MDTTHKRIFGSLVVAASVMAACAAPPALPAAQTKPAEATSSMPAAASPAPAVALYKNLGNHTHKITTSSPLAQQYFDQGLTLIYAFNHEEAIKMFNEAIRLDPNCAMCQWGVAYALGPNINWPMDGAVIPQAHAAVQKAQALAAQATPAEQAYIKALATRYTEKDEGNRAELDKAYASAMREVAKQFPEDADAATLFGEALMDLMPWNFWTKAGEPTEYTPEILATLEAAMKLDPNHPGANHYYIHATEASQKPEVAIPSAERLATLVPDAGHLVHMPAHVYWRTGRYQDAITSNEHAIHSDEGHNFIPDGRTPALYPALYFPHNIHFLFAAESMAGKSAAALESARKLVSSVPMETYQAFPFLEDFPPMTLLAMVRFGKWDDILKEPKPPETMQYTTGIWHYARGMALLRQGKIEEAEKENVALAALAGSKVMQEFGLSTFATAGQLLSIAQNTLEGAIAGAKGDMDHMIEHLKTAVSIQDELPYIEPPAWYFPVRQALGVALLDKGAADEAELVYREDLKQYPNNGWSLYGLVQSLKAQGKDQEAAETQKLFEEAWQHADVKLSSSWQ